jgi:hypothetical protein
VERKQKVSQLRPKLVISLSSNGWKTHLITLINLQEVDTHDPSPAAAAIERCPCGEQIVLLALNS